MSLLDFWDCIIWEWNDRNVPHLFCIIGIVAYIFIANYLGQALFDSKKVFLAVRDVVIRANKNER
jgi:hypothetical protein